MDTPRKIYLSILIGLFVFCTYLMLTIEWKPLIEKEPLVVIDTTNVEYQLQKNRTLCKFEITAHTKEACTVVWDIEIHGYGLDIQEVRKVKTTLSRAIITACFGKFSSEFVNAQSLLSDKNYQITEKVMRQNLNTITNIIITLNKDKSKNKSKPYGK